jgi:hypothetical protein
MLLPTSLRAHARMWRFHENRTEAVPTSMAANDQHDGSVNDQLHCPVTNFIVTVHTQKCTVTMKLVTEPHRRGRLNSDVAPCHIMSTTAMKLVTQALDMPKSTPPNDNKVGH